jgi:SAM-dependent methyltransferase
MDDYFYALRYDHDLTEWRAIIRRATLHLAWELYGCPDPDREPYILDVGCGTGVTGLSFAGEGRVFGVDSSALAVDFARQRGLMRIAQSVGEGLPFASGHFDLITSSDVLEHIEDDEAVLREMSRVARPGGLLVVVVPAFPTLWSNRDERLQHKRRYRREELSAKVAGAGFEVLRSTYCDSFLFPPLWLLVKTRLLTGDDPKMRLDVAPSTALDQLWLTLARAERSLLRRHDLPAGASALCIARRPGSPLPAAPRRPSAASTVATRTRTR